MPRKQNPPIESSWRVVEGGENDSFDTSILRDTDDELVLSSGNPSQLSPSQLSGSQPFSIGGSQDDNLQSFLTKAEHDEQVITRSPFRPSVPQSVRQSSKDNMKHRSPDPEFRYPTVDVDGPRRPGVTTRTSSSRTVRPADFTSRAALRRRQVPSDYSPTKGPRRRQSDYDDDDERPLRRRPSDNAEDNERKGFAERLGESLPDALFNILAWFFGVIGLAFRYAQKPLAILLGLYFIFGGLILAQNMVTKSIYTSLSPICRIPGTSYLDLPFCPKLGGNGEHPQSGDESVEFDSLMNVQERFEEVLEKSAQGVSLPMEMKRSEASVRDLRTMVRYSELQGKEELVLEFDGFIEAANSASRDLQRFNSHVGSAVDSVISINRWTSRYIDGLAEQRANQGTLERWAAWAFAPFQPAEFSEQMLRDQYVEHTALVSDKIGGLIVEAQAVLGTLTRAEDHLSVIYDFVTRTSKTVAARKDEVFWQLWTLLGKNTQSIRNFNSQLSLLKQVDGQRAGAVAQVSELIVELEKIQAGLGDLRDRVAVPELARGSRIEVPLAVHIETIDKGVERLEMARSRIREIENERLREVLARGKPEERLIDA